MFRFVVSAEGNEQEREKKAAAGVLLGQRGTESLFSHSNAEDSDDRRWQ